MTREPALPSHVKPPTAVDAATLEGYLGLPSESVHEVECPSLPSRQEESVQSDDRAMEYNEHALAGDPSLISLRVVIQRGQDHGFGFLHGVTANGFVTDVVANSPADRAGSECGDRIVTVDGVSVESRRELATLVGAKSASMVKSACFGILRPRPRVVCVLGTPGSNKRKLCAGLASGLGMVHLSTGDLLRRTLKRRGATDPVGAEIARSMTNGDLVRDDLVLNVLRAAAAVIDPADLRNGIVLSGFPMTVAQANMLEHWMGMPSSVVLLSDGSAVASARQQSEAIKRYHHKGLVTVINIEAITSTLRPVDSMKQLRISQLCRRT